MAFLMDLPQVGARRTGAAAGVYFAIGEVSGFGSTALLGFLYDATGTFGWGIVVLASIALVALVQLWVLRRTLVYASGSEAVAAAVPKGAETFEYRHAPEPRSVETTLLPLIEELRHKKRSAYEDS